MQKIKMKKCISFALSIIMIIMMFAYVTGIGVQTQAAEEFSPFGVTDEELDAARRQFHGDSAFSAFSAEPAAVYINESNIIHKPQEYKTPELSDFSMANYAELYDITYDVGDTRSFYTDSAAEINLGYEIQGKLVAQGKHVNIWVLDDSDFHAKTGTSCDTYCHLADINQTLGEEIADAFDPIYEAMTDPLTGFAAHANVQLTNTPYSSMPVVGDIGNDGKVNFLLYDLYGDGIIKDDYTAGFFVNSDFFLSSGNALDMLHIDIGHEQGYKILTNGNEDDKLDFYSTMSHEFQHLLFYMYYGVYTPNADYDSDAWMNETLAEFAAAFYTDTKTHKELVSYSTVSSAAQNSYLYGGYTNKYYDFLNHGSFKNYNMERLFAHVLHKKYPNIARNIYEYIEKTYPLSEFAQNTAKIKSMPQAVGDFLKAGTNIGTGAENSFTLIYYLFMESFAADGGMIYDISSNPFEPLEKTTKAITPTSLPINNLWAVRPVAGVANGRVYSNESQTFFYSANSYEKIPLLVSGGSISLKGYSSQNAKLKEATHEMFYKLESGGADKHWLTITAPDENDTTLYYAAIPQDELITGSNTYTSGENGASLYPLKKGMPVQINTQGKEAYLFVVTLYKDVNSSVLYSWSDVKIELCQICLKNPCECILEDILENSGLGVVIEDTENPQAGSFIKGNAQGMTKADLDGVTIYEVINGNRIEVEDDERKIGTGMIITKGEQEVIAVITGDLTGNGESWIDDANFYLETLVGNETLDNAQKLALRGIINESDSAIMRLRAFLNFTTAGT